MNLFAKMTRTDHFKMIFEVFKDLAPHPTCGILTAVLLSCVLFGFQHYFSFTQSVFSIGAVVFTNGHFHRLLTYPFYHQTLAQLLLNITTLAFLGGSLEKGFGTVRFLFLSLLLSTTTGLLYSFLDLMQIDSAHTYTEGLLPLALACVTLTTMHTKMTKGFLCGVSFPTMALPWVFLIITTALIPRSVLPCNIIALLVGLMYGKGWFSLVDLSEARAGVLEKMMPFRLLKRISGVAFVPASAEERRKAILPQINPTPGSYPVQAYAPVSSINTADTPAKFYEGWPSSASALSSPTPPLSLNGHGSGHNFGLSHGHCSEQTFSHSCNHNHSHAQL
uniref:rhomboid domain-containing protein 2 n=1 Tax=Scatophagus argus TaxID=75038 RepID=UPI001ED7DA99|nr:rhomboid domain-containing protein 2 [Scatophagus argus]